MCVTEDSVYENNGAISLYRYSGNVLLVSTPGAGYIMSLLVSCTKAGQPWMADEVPSKV